ncbi:MAG TPA: transaldolase [Candidatus Sulfotelmatobacter sp.]|jgi:transaldolase|nr:transaldolase [Candidatus Sulfotelmatobacter sp.]
MKSVSDLRVQIFADGADKASMLELYRQPFIKGFTTNPTLMRAIGITDYEGFALDLLATIQDRPISFEVFADDEPEMEEQARHIAAWGRNVFVKVPVMTTNGAPTYDLVRHLSKDGIQLNVTALLTLEQVRDVCGALQGNVPAYVSVFAGRIADTGCDPVPLMREAVAMVNDVNAQLIWASPRELLNVFQADEIGCHVITATTDILKKLPLVGKDLHEFSQETVQMFRRDAVKSGYSLPTARQGISIVSRR